MGVLERSKVECFPWKFVKVRVHEHFYLFGKRDEMLSNNSSSLHFDSNFTNSLRDLRNGGLGQRAWEMLLLSVGKSKDVDKKGTTVSEQFLKIRSNEVIGRSETIIGR